MKIINKVEASPQERSIYHLWKKNKKDTGINLAFGLEIENLDINRLEEGLNKIIARHDRLRSTFAEENNCLFRMIWDKASIKIRPFYSHNLTDFIHAFDIEKGPLIHAGFHENILYLDICHIITDGISMAVFFTELDAFYSGKEVKYIPSPLSIPDRQSLENNTDFWAKEFKSPFPLLKLPGDKTGFNKYGGRGNSLIHFISEKTTKRVINKCKELSITTFIYYFSSFLFFIYKTTNSLDLITSTNFSCRSGASMRSIALLTNLAPFRMKLFPSLTVKDFISTVADKIKEAIKHQNFDSELLLSQCDVEDIRDLSRTVFTYEHQKFEKLSIAGKKCRFIPVPTKHSAADLTVCFFPSPVKCRILAIFRWDLYSFSLIRNYMRLFQHIAEEFLDTNKLLKDI